MFAPLLLAIVVANTWYVDVGAVPPGNGTPGSPYTSIQYALDQPATVEGDTLLCAPGLYVENVHFTKRVLVEGTGGPTATRLRAATAGTVVLSTISDPTAPPYAKATISNFTIEGTGNTAGRGAAVNIDFSVLAMKRCIVTGFTAGTGIYQNMTNWVDASQCTIAGNLNGIHSLSVVHGGTINLNACIVRDNVVDAVNAASSIGYEPYRSCVPPALLPYGSGNFTGSPGFWDSAGGDFHLEPLSICIDKGGFGLPLDPDGSVADTGALTYDPLHAPFPASYCTPKINSLGCAVSISSTGSASLSGPDNFFLTASPALNNKPGLFLWSGAPQATPFAGATLCLKSPIVRGTPLSSGGSPSGNDCTGVFQWHFSQAYMASKGILAGSILYAQAWGRDNGFAPPNNAQLSDARVFPVGP